MLWKALSSVLTLFFTVKFVILVSGRNLPCDKNSENISDEIFGHMIGYGNNSRKFPLNSQEMTTYCR
jgi:hypothetical protein